MNNRKVLLLEPPYKNKYPPMGLMKISTYFRNRGDDVRFFKGDLKQLATELFFEEFIIETNDEKLLRYQKTIESYIKTGKNSDIATIPGMNDCEKLNILNRYRDRYKKEDFPKYDFVGITTLFTFYWKEIIDTINSAKKFKSEKGQIMVGGIASTILPQQIEKDTGISPFIGLLNKKGDIDADNDSIIDELPLDYSILDEINYQYPANNAYFAYMTRGCPNRCPFCAVPRLEPKYCNYIGIKKQLEIVKKTCGEKKDLLLMDNNVFASDCFDIIIDEIKDCGFAKGATYNPPNEYEIAYNNVREAMQDGKNVRGYIAKMIKIYDAIAQWITNEEELSDFYLKREEFRLLYPILATPENIVKFDDVARPLILRGYKQTKRMRYVDFNQGVDARLITDEKMRKMAEIAIRPLRIAFDHYEMKETYINAIKIAANNGIKYLSNYLLYNFNDKPEHLYERMRINVDLCEELGISIYSFPMKYHPIDDPQYFNNRNYIGKYWNRKFIRAIQAVLNATKGKIGRGKNFFEEAFGRDVNEFIKILWMPEAFIIYRRKYDAAFRTRMSEKYSKPIAGACDLTNEWWSKFNALGTEQLASAKKIIANNKFKDGEFECEDESIIEVLEYYRITRNNI